MAFSSDNYRSVQKNPERIKTQSWNHIRSLIPLSSRNRIKFRIHASSWKQIRKFLTCIPVAYGGYSKLTASCTSIYDISRGVIHDNTTTKFHHVDDHNHNPSSTRSSVHNHGNGSYQNSTIPLLSELGPKDLGRDTIEMIFKSSWLGKGDDHPICKIERILKVHNTQSTIQRFEECRDSVRILKRCDTSKNPRCAADGNEQLRFYCTNLTCPLDSSICNSVVPGCGVCSVLRHGFPAGEGVHTTASSVKAHNSSVDWDNTRAMLVCRVIAGRVNEANSHNAGVAGETYDAVGAGRKAYGTYEELFVSNPEAVLPCFVVICTSQ